MALTDPHNPARRLPTPPLELFANNSFLLKRVGFAVKHRLMEAFEELGVGPYHHSVLALLEEDPRETQATIADALGLDRSHLVGVLDELEERGLVQRRRDLADRRRHVVSLTPEGRKTLKSLRAVVKQVDDEFLAPLDKEQRETLYTLLLELASHHDARCAAVVRRSADAPSE
jgi:DNA-binding MarR family transcriptional regulator